VSVPDLETYRRRAEEFVGALDSEYYEHFSGRKPVCDTAAVYDRYPELFTREAVVELDALYQRTVEEDAKRRLAYLIAFTVDGFMGEQTKHLVDEIANTEGSTTIEVDGETIGLRQAGVVQGNEADAARRARIQGARLAATEQHLNPLLERHWRRCHDLAGELDYPNYMELYSEVKGLDYGLLRAELETGRTHQIRVHLAHIGHPVVGDAVYGPTGAMRISGAGLPWARELERRVPRQFLHAAELSFTHPRTGESMRFRSPLPPDLAPALEWARQTSGGSDA